MTDAASANAPDHDYHIVARIERLPISRWHSWMRSVVGTAMFFDGFDGVAIAYVLPVLIPLWKLSPQDIGGMISIGYAGQVIGSLFFGWLGEKIGRIPSAIITITLFSLTSLGCIFVDSYAALFWLRFVQGIGLGGETPVMHAYINEFAKAKHRAKFTLVFQLGFAFGILGASLAAVWVVPSLGWRWMFILGTIPALMTVPLRWMIPESPRWLASRGRFVEADRILTNIESKIAKQYGGTLPPIPADEPRAQQAKTRVGDLFKGIYLRRTLTVWGLWFCTYFIGYGMTGWLPSLYRTQFHLSVQQALNFSFVAQSISICGSIAVAFLVDRTGRKPWFTVALLLASIPLFVLWFAPSMSVETVLILICCCLPCISSVSISLGMFTAENYPTHLRALGGGIAGAWLRVASVIGPYMVGIILPAAGLGAVFVMFGVAAVIGGIICALFATETGGKVLERVSPVA
jgi:putative MFS transporter